VEDAWSVVFGPVPSRRLGRSLGVNNIPPKHCTYACAYCQLGRPDNVQVERSPFYSPQSIAEAVCARVEKLAATGDRVDYLTFVPDGEPTLDVNLRQEIELLRPLGIPVAVISNASLLGDGEVREALQLADWVSVKVDTVVPRLWRALNRPHRQLEMGKLLGSMLEFAVSYRGTLVTETMLVAGRNDGEGELRELSSFLAELQPAKAYLSVPTRPPAEPWVRRPDEPSVVRAAYLLEEKGSYVECLTGSEGDAFGHAGDGAADLLATTAVHPMREEALRQFLREANEDWALVDSLLASGQLRAVHYAGETFYARCLNRE